MKVKQIELSFNSDKVPEDEIEKLVNKLTEFADKLGFTCVIIVRVSEVEDAEIG